MPLKRLLFAAVVLSCAGCNVQDEDLPCDDPVQNYIENTIDQLRAFKPSDDEYHQVERLNGKYLHRGGFIPVGEDGWVYCICHSFHDEDSEDIVIGDINMAIDHKGTLYVNRGHLCEGAVFWSTSPEGLSSMDDFFGAASDEKKDKWEPYLPSEQQTDSASR